MLALHIHTSTLVLWESKGAEKGFKESTKACSRVYFWTHVSDLFIYGGRCFLRHVFRTQYELFYLGSLHHFPSPSSQHLLVGMSPMWPVSNMLKSADCSCCEICPQCFSAICESNGGSRHRNPLCPHPFIPLFSFRFPLPAHFPLSAHCSAPVTACYSILRGSGSLYPNRWMTIAHPVCLCPWQYAGTDHMFSENVQVNSACPSRAQR